jgi:hypothetical protein
MARSGVHIVMYNRIFDRDHLSSSLTAALPLPHWVGSVPVGAVQVQVPILALSTVE